MFAAEIERWKGEHMLYRIAYVGSGEYKWFDEVVGTPDDHDVGRGLPPAQTLYHAATNGLRYDTSALAHGLVAAF